MKRAISLILTVALLLALTACGGSQDSGYDEQSPLLTDDSQFVYQPAADAPAAPQGGGALIAFAADSTGLDSGPNAGAWKGVQTFAEGYGFEAKAYTAQDASEEAALAALRQATESGASLVVCRGEAMGAALYQLQNNYPTVNYLLLESEPHSSDYVSYSTSQKVHCILFQEEQAGYLAGYAAVMEGNTSIGILGGEQTPGNVRYASGFLQGAEYAAELQGTQIGIRLWFCNRAQPDEEITARVSEWFAAGITLVFTVGELTQSCVDAAEGRTRSVFAAGWDENARGDVILGSAVLNRSAMVQQALYAFFGDGQEEWRTGFAASAAQMGYSDGAVGLSTSAWRFRKFERSDYERLYEQLRNSTLKVERYSDTDRLPELANIALTVE